MGLMDDAMRHDARAVSDTDEFGEAVTYTRAGGETQTITVIVDRNAPVRDTEYPVSTRVFDVQIAYDANNLVGLSSEPKQGDRIAVRSDPADTLLVNKEFIGLVSTDSGGWLVQFA